MDPQLKENLTARTTWTRGAFTLLFTVIYYAAFFLVFGVVLFQFVWTLLTGNNNQRVLNLGRSLAEFIHQALLYITYNTEEKPFPFGPWPDEVGSAVMSTPAKKPAAKTTPKAEKKPKAVKDETPPKTGDDSTDSDKD